MIRAEIWSYCDFRRSQTRPDQGRSSARHAAPTNKAELETILGMVNYLSKFAPNLSEITSSMRKLLLKNVEFHGIIPSPKLFRRSRTLLLSYLVQYCLMITRRNLPYKLMPPNMV
jgi:hypothetical protein